MKKLLYIISVLSVIFILLTFSACADSHNDSSNLNNGEMPSIDETTKEILPDGIEINFSNTSVWEVSNNMYISTTITPSDATDKEVTWSFSNPGIVSIYDNELEPLKPGTTTITATTCNGVSDTIEVEVKPVCYREFDLPLMFSEGTSASFLQRYEITEIDFSWYVYTSDDRYGQYAESIEFEIQGSKIYDAQGSSNDTISYIARINLYDKDGYLVDSQSISVMGLLLNDKFKKTVRFYDVPLSGAPYTARIVEF